jgi:hypothetical protein
MSALAVLNRLKEAGVKIAASDGQLNLEGPTDALSEDVLNELRAIKPALMVEATIAEWRAAVASVRTDNLDVAKLKAATLRFLDGDAARTAVENGWDAMALFGLHEGNAVKERVGCWGLLVFVAWGTYARTIDTIGPDACVLRTRSGATQTLPRMRAALDDAVIWWQHPGIMNAGSGSNDPDCA